MDKFTSSDLETLLSQPGYFFYRTYGSTGAWTKAVFANGASYAPAVEATDIAFDDVGDVQTEVSTETVAITISSGRVLDPDFINDLTGGLYTKETVAGTLVSGAEDVLSEGDFEIGKVFLLANQNGDGTAPTINSITGSVDGALVDGTDYEVVEVVSGQFGIVLLSGVTTAQTITVDYDYTPNAQVILKRGGVKIIAPIELAFQTTDSEDNYVQYIFYKCYSDGADGHGFSPENSAEPITMDLTFTAKKDTNREIGDYLFRKVFGGDDLGA